MYGPEGNSLILFLRDEVEGNIRIRGKTKLTSFPRDRTLSALLYIQFPLKNHIAKTNKDGTTSSFAIVNQAEASTC